MKLVLFDIDGTLLHADGAGVKATRQSLLDFYGVDGAPPGYSMAGKVDAQIVMELLEFGGVGLDDARARLADYWLAYTAELERTLPGYPVVALPGVDRLLTRLAADPQVVVGLLTGNLEAAAHLKLRAAGIDPVQFRLAAYGHEAETRDALPPLAVARARDALGHTFVGQDIVIIGDTPADITCGASLGVRTIGVATGRYTVTDLLAAGATYAFPDLADTDTVLASILAPEQGFWTTKVTK